VLLELCLFAPQVRFVCSVVRGNRAADAGIKMGEHVIDINGEYVKDKTVFERSVRGPALKHALYTLFTRLEAAYACGMTLTLTSHFWHEGMKGATAEGSHRHSEHPAPPHVRWYARNVGNSTAGDTTWMTIEGVPPRGKKRGEQRKVGVTVGARGVANIETVCSHLSFPSNVAASPSLPPLGPSFVSVRTPSYLYGARNMRAGLGAPAARVPRGADRGGVDCCGF
jgi:hypothetical protein